MPRIFFFNVKVQGLNIFIFFSETHTKRQATQHDCLPSLLGDGDK
jgi:hypothetical protein